ncbi:TPA: PLP-dependent aminotransferase family protein [Klebsiella aerogenes]|uniref:aminotransferase-like domain-containing protein n=1 Tax=Klebsiella aerogenes TaxID=548 RepID=UPI0007B3A051|nr:PLP-dependent aminotransferase family protein [Klebsiella aerogenes]KZQ01012.1 GntR family transcriptional regulator [Klebsiella aerogenes]HBT4641863.1 PLP-dependent aminotransferase family protein [Klebsiella aerogenes]
MKNRYKSLVDRYAAAIRSGALAAGSQLPTHRQLVVEHGISLATATRVYRELALMGLVSGETGRGTFVRELSLPPGLGVDQHAIAPDMIDLNFNSPALPEQTVLLREALKNLSGAGDLEALLRYQPHAGRMSEREIVAQHLNRQGMAASAGQVAIVNGAQHGLAVTLGGLLRPGDVVAADALTYPGFRALARLYQLELVAIPHTTQGPDLDMLRSLCEKRRVKAIYTMPTLHNPLGWVMNLAQRSQLVDIARQFDLFIIEDAAYAWLIENAPPPLMSLAPERTVYVCGFSKNIATGLRVGMVVCREALMPAIERTIRATSWNTPALTTALVCGWIQDGTLARLETIMRADARRRQAIARQALAGLPMIGNENAWFLWLPLGEDVRADRVVKQLLTMNIAISTAEPYSVGRDVPHALRLALASPSLDKLSAALKIMRPIIEYGV